MNVVITGHRIQKLQCYDIEWIKCAIYDTLSQLGQTKFIRGYSGMASGVDLWFCDSLQELNCRWVACIPFDGQELTMDEDDAAHRQYLIDTADKVFDIRNSKMVEYAERGIVVWDGNKGGTHNVLQQFVEKEVPFHWINPVSKKVWDCS